MGRWPAAIVTVALALAGPGAAGGPVPAGVGAPARPGAPCVRLLVDVTATNLPAGVLSGRDMDARPADLDGDGDLDLVVAVEFGRNIVLRAEAGGVFAHVPGALPDVVHDSEDIAVADFDDDGDLDLVFVSEDDQINEHYLNDGTGLFTDASDRIPVQGTSNAVITALVNDDPYPDLIIGNDGQNRVLINDGKGFFTDETASRLPAAIDVTQDVELGDVDGDGDLDLIVGNEDDNKLLINDGSGVFADETAERLPLDPGLEETREADFGDVDGDGDLDLVFANVNLKGGNRRQNRLLLNDGAGVFTDVTAEQLPADQFHTLDADFVDLDADGDLDIVVAHAFGGNFHVYVNDGTGTFVDETAAFLPPTTVGSGIDIEAADFNADGAVDLFLTNYTSADILLFSRAPCPADLDCDDVVGFADLLAILDAWGPCGSECPEDLDGSGTVDFDDLLTVLVSWGPCGRPSG